MFVHKGISFCRYCNKPLKTNLDVFSFDIIMDAVRDFHEASLCVDPITKEKST